MRGERARARERERDEWGETHLLHTSLLDPLDDVLREVHLPAVAGAALILSWHRRECVLVDSQNSGVVGREQWEVREGGDVGPTVLVLIFLHQIAARHSER